jgi:hypothetical protein
MPDLFTIGSGGTMRTFIKYAGALTLAGAMALAAATPSQARWHGGGAAIAGGFVAGALVGAAVANNGYYRPGYGYYGPGYAHGPGYAYSPAYDDSYAYEPAPTYYSGRTYYRSNGNGCTSSGSPASQNFGATC